MLFGKYLNKYYRKYLPLYLIGLVALVVVDYAQLYVPEFLGQLVEAVGNNTISKETILSIIKTIVLIAFVICIGRISWRLSIFKASHSIEAGLRHEMFNKAERLSQSYYHSNKVGTIMAWFTNDLENIEEFIGWGTVMLIDAVFLTICCAVKMFKLDWALTIISSIPIACIVIWGALVEKYMSERWEERQKTFDGLYDYAEENFSGIHVIKAFVKETKEILAFSKVAKKSSDANIKFAKVSVTFDVLIELIIGIIVAFLTGFGAYCVYLNVAGRPLVLFGHLVNLGAGDLVTYLGYFDELIWPLIAMGQIVSMRSRSKTALKRITAYLDQNEDITNKEDAIVLKDVKGKIEFKNFSFSYPDNEKQHYLEDISLTIQPGEMIGIVGKVGSGKTTLVNSLLRLYNVKEGTLFIDGIDIMDINIESLRDNISYAPQDNFLFSDKIKNNISFSDHEATFEQMKSAAVFADIDGNIAGFEKGYDTMIGERGATLSGGQKQRLSIARAYLKNAPIMIMDDCVSAVDTKTEEVILDNLHKCRDGKTTIMIASRVSTIAHMDKIIVLNEGKLEGFDTPANLLKTSETYQKMVRLQKLENEVKEGKN